jgi:flagellar motility protein MotE (MotC chaperone)
MKKILTSGWMTIVASAVIYFCATYSFWRTPVRAREIPAAATTTGVNNGPAWDFTNPEADQLMAELKAEKAALAKKEQDLSDLGTRLEAERAEVEAATGTVKKLQADFDQNVLRIKEEEVANLKKLAKVYADMAPESAADIFAELDDSAVEKIMVFMKDSETAAIFEALSKKGQPQAKRAANISERLRLALYRNAAAAAAK